MEKGKAGGEQQGSMLEDIYDKIGDRNERKSHCKGSNECGHILRKVKKSENTGLGRRTSPSPYRNHDDQEGPLC
ncbi:hypothetical protein LIP_0130 [Limnochorda pilosa]|uniref:Uncharacterized protein n=1 Tax=Limnochorda pilosa TaxID=1555112 RepID=A0A0K2SG23_LIMPI|nr:hypothetical protein LIP_0130 [Limnochorda pilosa]